MLRSSYCQALAVSTLLIATAVARAQRTNVTIDPFLSFPPSGSAQSMTGLALSVSAGPLALRAGGHISLQDREENASSTSAMRPWGADLDALAYLDNLSYGDVISFAPYVFVGIGASALDSGGLRVRRAGWSYGSGLALPLGRAFGIFGEYRWRMSRFVSPHAPDAPSPTSEARVGMSFRVGAGGTIYDAPVVPAGEAISWDSRSSRGAVAARVVATAAEYVGAKYRRGGASPASGFDAAGFIRFVFAQLGLMLPRTSREQARVGERVAPEWHMIEAGDVLVFEDEEGNNHVAIYAGRNRIIHSSETGGGVRYDDLSSERGRWFLERMVAVRRLTPDLRGLVLNLARDAMSEDGAATPDRPDRAPRPARRRP